MNKKEKLLMEMISAINYLGLNWYDILEDYLEHQLRNRQKSIQNFDEIIKIAKEIQSDLCMIQTKKLNR